MIVKFNEDYGDYEKYDTISVWPNKNSDNDDFIIKENDIPIPARFVDFFEKEEDEKLVKFENNLFWVYRQGNDHFYGIISPDENKQLLPKDDCILMDKDIRKNAFQDEVENITNGLATLLVEKNIAYGDSFSNPINIFSDGTPMENLKVRIDDKLSRLARGKEYENEDTVTDLIGYLVLLKILINREKT